MQPLNGAVIGVGNMGKNHARVLAELESCRLVAVCDAALDVAESIGRKYGVPAYASVAEMLRQHQLDFAVVAVPTRHHRDVALELVNEGVHLLLEKPIAENLKQAEEIVVAAQQKGIKLLIGHIERFSPVVQALKERLDKGELGRIYKIDTVRVSPFPNQINDVGVTLDIGVHDIDLVCYLTGSDITSISAQTISCISTDYEDVLVCLLTTRSGVIATINANWITPTKIRTLKVLGERGMFVIDHMSRQLTFYENASLAGISREEWKANMTEGRAIRYPISRSEPLRNELEHFVSCILNDTEPLVTGAEGVLALKHALRVLEEAK